MNDELGLALFANTAVSTKELQNKLKPPENPKMTASISNCQAHD